MSSFIPSQSFGPHGDMFRPMVSSSDDRRFVFQWALRLKQKWNRKPTETDEFVVSKWNQCVNQLFCRVLTCTLTFNDELLTGSDGPLIKGNKRDGIHLSPAAPRDGGETKLRSIREEDWSTENKSRQGNQTRPATWRDRKHRRDQDRKFKHLETETSAGCSELHAHVYSWDLWKSFIPRVSGIQNENTMRQKKKKSVIWLINMCCFSFLYCCSVRLSRSRG